MKKSRYLIIALLCAVAQGTLADNDPVTYIERSWTGGNTTGHVVETEKTCTSYTVFTSDLNYNGSELSGGWYVFRGTGSESYYGRVTIYGGTVEATGKSSGAGIGSGQDNDVTPKVYLTLGTVPFVR